MGNHFAGKTIKPETHFPTGEIDTKSNMTRMIKPVYIFVLISLLIVVFVVIDYIDVQR